jgi:hypothetical protein
MKIVGSLLLTLGLMSPATLAGQEKATSGLNWYYPDDTKAVCKQWPQKPYKAAGLPDGTSAATTDYCKPGFRVQRPTAPGFWQINSVLKLYYKGRLFAVYGSGTCLSEEKHELGCIDVFVVYDPDGHGKLTEPGEVYDKNGQIDFHTPPWVLQ